MPEDEIYAQERGWCSYACYDKAFKRNRARQLRAAAAAVRRERELRVAATRGHRGWGWVRRLPSGRYQASYQYAGSRHNAAHTFTAKLYAEGWLAAERRLIEHDEWTPPKERKAKKKAGVVSTADSDAATWIEHRNVKPRTRIEYTSILDWLIVPVIGEIAVSDLTPETVREWYAGLGRDMCAGTVTLTAYCTPSVERLCVTVCSL